MKIKEAQCAYEPEPFKYAFGFKGSSLTGVWQTAVRLSDGENTGLGLGVQSVLWSDNSIFAFYGEDKSNKLMFSVTEYAVNYIKGGEFSDPHELLDMIFPKAYEFAKSLCGDKVTETFVLNALVPVDFASWMLYKKAQNFNSFDSIFKGVGKAEKLANIPLITYNTPVEQVKKMADEGTGIFKIKIGSDPDKDGDLKKMLLWDKARIKNINDALKNSSTPYTETGKPVYYFDANGRYDSRERLIDLIEFMDKEGILESTVLFEEPFEQGNKIFIGDLPLSFAADESAHSMKDVKERIYLGYNTITLKPVAKTLSITKDMAEYAIKNNVQCFCADLTVNPVMVQWNKNFAARLPNIKGMRIGILESNGAQNYVNWEKMLSYMTYEDDGFSHSVFCLDNHFYQKNGGIFEMPEHYSELFKR